MTDSSQQPIMNVSYKSSGDQMTPPVHHANGGRGLPRLLRSRPILVGFGIVLCLSICIIYAAWRMTCELEPLTPKSIVGNLGEHNGDSSSSDEETPSYLKGLERKVKKVYHVEIYYETLCPDSKYFIVKQFLPFFTRFTQNPTYVETEEGGHSDKDRIMINPIFVPYGKADTRLLGENVFQFDCQHGETECEGNKVHACATKYLEEPGNILSENSTPDQVNARNKLLSYYLACMINDNRNPGRIAEKCAQDLKIDYQPIYRCWKESNEGSQLLHKYGVMTKLLKPEVSFIPTIQIDGRQDNQAEILKNFKSFMCHKIRQEHNVAAIPNGCS